MKKLSGVVFSFLTLVSAGLRANEQTQDCVIEPSMVVELSSQARGVLETVSVERGDYVKKEQLVAKMMSGVEEAGVRLARYRASMDVDIKSRKAGQLFRENTFQQIKQLYNKNMASLREYDDAKTLSVVADHELEKAKALKRLAVIELQRAKEILKQRSIYSTVDGVVIEVMKSPGEYIEDQPVLKIAQINPLYVEVIVPEMFINDIKVGNTVNINVNSGKKLNHAATVKVVDQVIDASSGTFGVRLELPNPDYKIHAGQRCKTALFEISTVNKDLANDI